MASSVKPKSYNPGSSFTPTSGYGTRINPLTGKGAEFHPGQDYAAASGTAIPAASSGTVVYSGFNSAGYGNTVIIKSVAADGTSYYTLYAHQNGNKMPSVGAIVGQGDTIGEVGSTGRSTAPHLHFEVLSGNAPVNNAAGGPLGFTSSDQSIRYDPNSFNNWNGANGPYGVGSSPSNSGLNGPQDMLDGNGNLKGVSYISGTSGTINQMETLGVDATGNITIHDLQNFSTSGSITSEQLAAFDPTKNLTQVSNFSNGAVSGSGIIEGQATSAQLNQEAQLASQLSGSTMLADATGAINGALGIQSDANASAAIKSADGSLAAITASVPTFATAKDFASWISAFTNDAKWRMAA